MNQRRAKSNRRKNSPNSLTQSHQAPKSKTNSNYYQAQKYYDATQKKYSNQVSPDNSESSFPHFYDHASQSSSNWVIPSQSQPSSNTVSCNCRSNCSKYCPCYNVFNSCNSNCKCRNCVNLKTETSQSIPSSRTRIHGCRCQKTKCRTMQCICLKFGKKCTSLCICTSCQNHSHQPKTNEDSPSTENIYQNPKTNPPFKPQFNWETFTFCGNS